LAEHNLPRGWENEASAALGDEDFVAGAQVRADPASADESLIFVTATRFLHVTRAGVSSWPVSQVGVAEVQEYSKGQPGGLTLVTEDGIHRFAAANRDSAYGCELVSDELRFHTVPALTTRIAELTWWDAKPAWPHAAIGRIAGGTLGLEPGQDVSVGLGRRGVSLYPPGQAAPFLQVAWPEVTAISVDSQDELKERLGPTVVRAMGLLEWRFKSRGLRGRLGLEGFISIATKTAELYVAAKADASDLRKHWDSVLHRFEPELDPALLTLPEDQTPAAGPTGRRSTDRDVVEELERLAALHASGALTDGEYAAAKASILGRTEG
jgi:hypothetical protein